MTGRVANALRLSDDFSQQLEALRLTLGIAIDPEKVREALVDKELAADIANGGDLRTVDIIIGMEDGNRLHLVKTTAELSEYHGFNKKHLRIMADTVGELISAVNGNAVKFAQDQMTVSRISYISPTVSHAARMLHDNPDLPNALKYFVECHVPPQPSEDSEKIAQQFADRLDRVCSWLYQQCGFDEQGHHR